MMREALLFRLAADQRVEMTPTAGQPTNPLIVQSDRGLLLEVHNPLFEPARMALSSFAELEKGPEHVHSGEDLAGDVDALLKYDEKGGRYPKSWQDLGPRYNQ